MENAEKGKIFTPFPPALSLPAQVILSAWLSAQAVSCFLDIYLLHIHAFFSYHPPAWNPSSFQNPPGITFKTHLRSQAFPDASSSPLLQGGSAPPSVLGCVMVMMALEEGREMVVGDHYWPRGTVLSALQSLFQLIFTTTL